MGKVLRRLKGEPMKTDDRRSALSRHPSELTDEHLRLYTSREVSIMDLARMLGRSLGLVHRWLNQAGIDTAKRRGKPVKSRPRRTSVRGRPLLAPAVIEEIVQLRAAGWTQQALAKKYRVTHQAIGWALREHAKAIPLGDALSEPDRVRLRFGPYRTPDVELGERVRCAVRGLVTVCGLSLSRIPWPIGKRGRAKAPVVFQDLKRALQREAGVVICHWWSITAQTVSKWRRALGLTGTADGTSLLLRAHAFSPACADGLRKAQAKANDPERCAKIAAANRGKPRPPHVIQAMIAGRRGKKHSVEARRRMSEAQRNRRAWPPAAGKAWAPWEDELVRTLPAAHVATRTGRTLGAVYARRRDLEMPDGRRRERTA